MSDDVAAQAAEMLLAARRNRKTIDGLPPGLKPADEAQAYRIQAAYVPMIAKLSGGKPVGRKIGATNPQTQANMGITQPFRGILLSPFVHDTPARIPAEEMFIRVLEVELAFRVGEDIAPSATPWNEKTVAAKLAAILPAIEVVDSRYTQFTQAGGLQLAADNAAAGHWVRGPERTDWRDWDLTDYKVSLSVNGEVKEQGSSAAVLGNPLTAMAWLANSLGKAGETIKAGELITTGTCTKPLGVAKGDKAVADLGRLGQVSVEFV